MRKTNTQKLSDVLKEYLEKNNLDQKIKVSRIPAIWNELMGNIIAQKTTNIYLKNKTLYISVNSSVLRNELIMMRSRVIRLMNDKLGGNFIENVVIR